MRTNLSFDITHALDAQHLAAENTQSEILDFIAELVAAVDEPAFAAAVIERLERREG